MLKQEARMMISISVVRQLVLISAIVLYEVEWQFSGSYVGLRLVGNNNSNRNYHLHELQIPVFPVFWLSFFWKKDYLAVTLASPACSGFTSICVFCLAGVVQQKDGIVALGVTKRQGNSLNVSF